MDNLISTLSFLHFLLLMLSHFRATFSANYASICAQTPYPKLCHSLVTATATTKETLDEDFFELHYMSMKMSLARAENVHTHILQMDLTTSNELAKAAWTDCLELYKDTIYLLNMSLNSDVTMFHDTQTWLSAAIANQQTCRNGFHDFNLSVNHLDAFPYLNLFKSLSNSLAINKARVRVSSSAGYSTDDDDHFPNWFTNNGRRLMDSSIKADAVVARDGSGDYTSISEAIRGMVKVRKTRKWYVIYVKRGVYEESVQVKRSMRNLMVVGDGVGETIVTAGNSVGDGFTTFRSATFGVSGDGFIARGVTFRNTAGPGKHQGVALRSSSDFSVFYGCSFEGYQDTLYVHSRRQFYRDCHISGTVDFIFGDAAVVFQGCDIRLRRPLPGQTNTVTAQARKDPNENTGFVRPWICDRRCCGPRAGPRRGSELPRPAVASVLADGGDEVRDRQCDSAGGVDPLGRRRSRGSKKCLLCRIYEFGERRESGGEGEIAGVSCDQDDGGG